MDMVDQMVVAVDGLVRRSLAPLAENIRSLEQWRKEVGDAPGKNGKDGIDGKDGAPGRDGKDAPPVDIAEVVKLIPIPRDGRDGKDAPPVDIAEVVKLIPIPRDGRDGKDGKDGRDGVDGEKGERGADGQDGKDGRDGIDGKGIDGRDGKDGIDGKDGNDGVGIDRLVVDQKSVEFILTDGRSAVAELPAGPAGDPGRVGEKGEKGEKGDKGDPPTVADVEAVVLRYVPELVAKALEAATPAIVAKAAALVPPGRDGQPGLNGRPGAPGEDGIDGKDGKDGRDAFDIEDFNVQLTGRTLTLSLEAGGRKVERQLKMEGLPRYVGTFASGKSHDHGDMVTYGGSVWMTKRDTSTSPPGEDWQLVVKGTR